MSAITQNKQGLRVLITGSILQLFLGILYVWSVFVEPVSFEYEWEVDSVKLMTSFMLSFFVIGILTGGKLLVKIGTEKVVLIGGMMLAGGMLVSSFLPPSLAWLMYLTYGVIGGFGVGSAYNSVITAAQKWFPENRGFATGVAVCAFGFSTVVFAPLIRFLVGQFEIRNTFLILAISFFAVVIILFKFIRLPDSTQQSAASEILLAKKQYTVTQAIQTKEFYFITISLMFATAAFFILNPSFLTLSIQRGLGESIGIVVVMLTGVANALGRLVVPLLSDKVGREKAALAIILATSLSCLLLNFTGNTSEIIFVFAVMVITFCFGGFPGIYAVLASDYFGIKNAGSNYGAIMIGFALSALVFPILFAMINDITIKFIALAALAAAGAKFITLLMLSKERKNQVENFESERNTQ